VVCQWNSWYFGRYEKGGLPSGASIPPTASHQMGSWVRSFSSQPPRLAPLALKVRQLSQSLAGLGIAEETGEVVELAADVEDALVPWAEEETVLL
jgi:hypothetical protein